MIYLSAGHHFNPDGNDPGACANGWQEANLTQELRDLTANALQIFNAKYTLDKDDETLPQYLKRIKPGSGSVVCDLHFNSAKSLATGIEVIVKESPDMHERRLAADICNLGTQHIGVYNRGVKTEKQSNRSKLAMLHTGAGISVLVEVCFINNSTDMIAYQRSKKVFAEMLAKRLQRYDDIYT